MPKPKILSILHLPPPIHGAALMGKIMQESEVINKSFEIDYINLSTSKNLDEIGKGGIQKIIGIIKLQIAVLKALRKTKYDLCYLTLAAKGSGFYKDVLIVLLLKLFGQSIIFHFHNKGVAVSSEKKINDFLYRITFKNTKTILLAKALYQDVKKYFHEEDVYICPNGIQPVANFPEKLIPAGSKCRMLFLSNMMQEKGVFILLEACSILKKKGIDFECHFVGPWSRITEDDFYTKAGQLGIADYVDAHGKKYGVDKENYFINSDLFVFPTYDETFGLVNLEAMQHFLPIVSTFEGGIPDVVKDGITGYLVPPQDAKALAERLEDLITNPELRKKMGKAGNQRLKEHFTLEKFEHNLKNILTQVINKKAL